MMGIGMGKCLVRFPSTILNLPYLESITEFWRRWHDALQSDPEYVYPLAANCKGLARQL